MFQELLTLGYQPDEPKACYHLVKTYLQEVFVGQDGELNGSNRLKKRRFQLPKR
jgi:hypothetical protein